MGPEHTPGRDHSIDHLAVTRSLIDGYFRGKIDEIGVEINDVMSWPVEVKLGAVIERRGQAIASLAKLKDEMERARQFVLNALGQTESSHTILSTESDKGS